MKIKNLSLCFFVVLALFTACKETKDYTQLVNVFVGTDDHGHTFPGAMMPHGMVQLSPDTRTTTWDGCSGYHYSDKSIMGFSHIHYSGVGSGGGADILLMPTVGKIQLVPGDPADTKSGYRTAFSHDQETASPGYYSVVLEDGIKVELTSTTRVGFHKYTFPATEKGNVILDLVHGINDKIDSLYLQKISDTKIAGFRHCHGGLDGDRTIYFYAEFSQPFSSFGFYNNEKSEENPTEISGKNVKAHFTFDTKTNKEVMVKVALSRVDIDGAIKNLKEELPGWNFDKIRRQAADAWNTELAKIEVDGGTETKQRTFYSAMYHVNIHPNISSDVDGRYRSTDRKVYVADDFENYTTYSLWDTFRALHPLYTIIDQKRTNQYIRSFIERYQHFGNLPIMEFGGSEGFAMIGYHSLPVIADAWAKGIRDYDVNLAYDGMKKLSEEGRTGKTIYKQLGFIPYDTDNQNVSKTLEYSYDDWSVSVLAKSFSEEDFRFYSSKGQFYRSLYDSKTGFMRPKSSDFRWFEPFDPTKSSGNYTEGNAWQYSMFVLQDINGLINLMGGDEKFETWLDDCFSQKTDQSEMPSGDVTGLIGQYAHGNEPSHHMAYLYNFAGKPWKTQEVVAKILSGLYSDRADGLCGNDDAGQMSAWYVFSSMGFYQVTPGLPYYVIGSPVFDKVTIHLENGKDFTIRTKKAGSKNIYIQSATLNGNDYSKSFLNHSDIMNGGEMVFTMGDSPNQSWGSKSEDRPHTEGYPSASIPEIRSKDQTFLKQATVVLSCNDQNTNIRYTTDGSDPVETSPIYSEPLTLTESATVKARGFASGLNSSYPVSMDFEKLIPTPAAELQSAPRPGLNYKYMETYCISVDDMKKFEFSKSGTIPTFSIAAINDDRAFAYEFSGYILIPASGIYSFSLNSNDGSNLLLDGKLLVDNDESRTNQDKWGKRSLEKGWHAIEVNYFQMGGKKRLMVSWENPDGKMEEIPEQVLFH